MKGHQQPTGRAQSPLSSAFPIIILLDNGLSSTLKVLVDGHGAQNCSFGAARVCGQLRYSTREALLSEAGFEKVFRTLRKVTSTFETYLGQRPGRRP